MKIAITQLGCLGDLVLATSAIDMIKDKYPNASIDFIVGTKNYVITEHNPNIANYIIYDKRPIKLLKFLAKLRAKKYDFYIDPKDHYSTESACLARMIKANTKIGFNDITKKTQPFDISIPSAKDNINKHFIEQIQSALLPLNVNETPDDTGINATNLCERVKYRPNIFIDNISISAANNYLQTNQIDSFILINISASGTNKMWLPDKWIELIGYIKTQTNLKIIIASDKSYADMASQIALQTDILHFPPASFQVIMALISKAKLLISPDTSLVHIASAFNIKQIVLANNVPFQLIKFAPLSSIAEVITPKQTDIYVPFITVEQVKKSFNKINI